MRTFILKLDDIGRDSQTPVFDVVAWALARKLCISIGTIGADLAILPAPVVQIIRLGVALGFVEIWNHGFRHIRYDLAADADIVADVCAGHEAIRTVFACEADGFGFPFNKFSEQAVGAIRRCYPHYFIYETDFPAYRLVSPEFNAFGDGQPRLSYFQTRLDAGDSLIVQAHPPRWDTGGFAEFERCVGHLLASRGFLCVSAREALRSGSGAILDAIPDARAALAGVAAGTGRLATIWTADADRYNATLSNFRAYFLPRFIADAAKNYQQTRAALYPFKAKRVLDLGCGLGNWSLPFWLAGDCESLVLNDVNATIGAALHAGMRGLGEPAGVRIDGRNLLSMGDGHGYQVEFLVCANTFNYLDPIDFFRFAQSAISAGGRLLLVVQTGAFNRQRFRNALAQKDRAVAAEVLASDLCMDVRRHCGIFPGGTRHVFDADEITRLAAMFDLTTQAHFTPHGEHAEDGESVYTCLAFKKTVGMRRAIVERKEWLDGCGDAMARSFGPRALVTSKVGDGAPPAPVAFDQDWLFPDSVSLDTRLMVRQIKEAITAIKAGMPIVPIVTTGAADVAPSLHRLADKVRQFDRATQP